MCFKKSNIFIVVLEQGEFIWLLVLPSISTKLHKESYIFHILSKYGSSNRRKNISNFDLSNKLLLYPISSKSYHKHDLSWKSITVQLHGRKCIRLNWHLSSKRPLYEILCKSNYKKKTFRINRSHVYFLTKKNLSLDS